MERKKAISQQSVPLILDSNYLIKGWAQWQAFMNMEKNLL
jgi:hypothetical protein